MKAACTSLEEPRITLDTLKRVREMEKRILLLDPLLIALGGHIDDLQELTRSLPDSVGHSSIAYATIDAALKSMRKEVAAYQSQATYVYKRAQLSAQSILDALNLGFQHLAQDQSKNTFIMASSAREDSIAIRAITLVTSCYLPFSFVAVSYLSPEEPAMRC